MKEKRHIVIDADEIHEELKDRVGQHIEWEPLRRQEIVADGLEQVVEPNTDSQLTVERKFPMLEIIREAVVGFLGLELHSDISRLTVGEQDDGSHAIEVHYWEEVEAEDA